MVDGNSSTPFNRQPTVCVQLFLTIQWYETQKLVHRPRNSEEEEEEEEKRPRRRAVDKNHAKARGSSMLKLTADRETLLHKASEQAVEIGLFCIINESVMDGNKSTLHCRDY